MSTLQWVATRNCRRFYKRTYELPFPADDALIQQLSGLGWLTFTRFSNYSSLAKDVFRIFLENTVDIQGTLGDTSVQVTIWKEEAELLTCFEEVVNEWLQQAKSSVSGG